MKFEYKAFVTRVYDGDTITVNIDLGMSVELKGVKLRLARINTPEVRGDERSQGIDSRDWLRAIVLNKFVTVKTIKDGMGKYGRYIAEVIINGINVNDELVKRGLAEYREY